MMRVLFMGSGRLACPVLQAILADPAFQVVGAVTQPDKPQGRRLELAACPVKAMLERTGLPVLTPPRINAPESLTALRALTPDVIVVVAYGQFLGGALLTLAPRGCVNVHASLLPRYRGAAPCQWAIARGETETGVTTMFLNARMDAGDMLLRQVVPIASDDTGGSLETKLAAAGAALLPQTLHALEAGTLRPVPQDESAATFAPKLTKLDGRLDWSRPAIELHNRVRAFNPWPACHCDCGAGGGRAFRLKVLRTAVEPVAVAGVPGQLLATDGAGPLVLTGRDALRLIEVQPEGKRAMGGADFCRGYAPHTVADAPPARGVTSL